MTFVDIHTHRPTGLAIEPSSAGIHPADAACGDFGEVVRRAAEVQFIGETGLDFVCPAPRRAQEEMLRRHLRLAAECRKPVVLHCVKAFEPLMSVLCGYSLRAVVFHGFIGSRQQAERAAAKGYFLSFGERAFRSPRTVEALKALPADRIFAETDDAEIEIGEIYRRIAEARGTTLEDLQKTILENYRQIFNDNEQ